MEPYISALVSLVVALVAFIIGLATFAFKAGKIYHFVEKMETNHLPHIYAELKNLRELILKGRRDD